ncbi:MAG: adenine deaminase [Thermoleophilia bacterium]|nr:adenine deaminase [Thermoleophilia bacterium]
MHERENCRRVALGLDPPTLLIRRGRVYSPFTGEFFLADVALCGRLIAGVGDYPAGAAHTIDARGACVIPGFIDAHVHPETSLLSPPRFAEALAVHGITTTISEPHEIVNILGRAGMDFYLQARAGLPLDLRLMVPTTVPASPFEQAAGRLTQADAVDLLAREEVVGLGEAMDYMGLIAGHPTEVLSQQTRLQVVDGHAPDVTGRDLAAYLIAGPISDHETSDPDLLLERRRLGMWILIREGSAARDLVRALPFLVRYGTERTALCTDDRNAAALAEHHHIDGVAGALVRAGVSLNDSLRAATLNPATLYRLHDRGSVTPGLQADLLVVQDPSFPHPHLVVQAGRVVARDGELTVALPATPPLASLPIRLMTIRPEDLAVPAPAGIHRVRAIHLAPRTIVSDERIVEMRAARGRLVADPDKDVALVALMERSADAPHIGLGVVSGLGLGRGAIATTIAHDAHHLLVTGIDPEDMVLAVQAVAATGGGLAVVDRGRVLTLPLPLAGLMTDLPVRVVAEKLRTLEAAAATLGVDFEEPFMVLSFITLSVIPRLRLTLDGVLDVQARELVPVLVT